VWIRKTSEVQIEGFGAKVRTAREKASREQGKSLEAICNEVGVSKTYWYSIEAETRRSIALETLRKIEKALKVDLGVEL
jgi:transcriptional regulator with XRE-family HTH domain